MDEKQTTEVQKIAEKVKKLRIEKGYTSYRNFADEHEIEPKQYWKLEEGKSDFRISSLIRILEIHNIKLEEFFRGL
ncbi:MAG: helix-turn-helix transcriptional regulator [Bacteroidetes bacterium]|nr:MAG: helix-turn-helix transcriptional regulator [Bacteroidota bacterium]